MKAFLGAFCAVLIAAGVFYFLTSKQRTEDAAKATGIAIAKELERSALEKELRIAIPTAEIALADAEEAWSQNQARTASSSGYVAPELKHMSAEMRAGLEASKQRENQEILETLAANVKTARERLERLKVKMAGLASR